MPQLKNPRYEAFSQELAKGTPAEHAYTAAGFRPSRQNASTLRHKTDISNRVGEILAERERIHGQSTAKAIERAALTKEWVITNLMDNALMALGKTPVSVSQTEGQPAVLTFERNAGAANRALELLGRELNMFIERHEVGDPGEWARMTDAELNKSLLEQARVLEIPQEAVERLLIEHKPNEEQI